MAYDVWLDQAYVPPDGAYDVRLYAEGAHSSGPTVVYRAGGPVSIGHVAGVVSAEAAAAGGLVGGLVLSSRHATDVVAAGGQVGAVSTTATVGVEYGQAGGAVGVVVLAGGGGAVSVAAGPTFRFQTSLRLRGSNTTVRRR